MSANLQNIRIGTESRESLVRPGASSGNLGKRFLEIAFVVGGRWLDAAKYGRTT
jgi:hypothetical protein